MKRSIDSGPVDQDRIESLNIEILRREQRLGKALSVQHLIAKPVPLAGGEDGPDRRAYALCDGAVWRSDLTGGLGRDELETQFVPAGAEGPNSRSGIPVAVRRAVWQRDYGRYAKCGRRERLEFDHIVPIARGGSNTERNVELLVFVYRLEVSALEAMSVVHEPRIWAAKERVGESEQAATTED